ncbi:MAG: PspA/IM30 family protein [Cytophagales bacterium]|nr:PspA/IM30 family protein [Bernardetiaceae bacterium]MDW8205349.1 PspA/IM30 family protein [Cytophagales bacterium]
MNDILTRIVQAIKSLFTTQTEQAADPVMLVEQNIRDLKAALSESLKSLAELKATYLRTQHEHHAQIRVANEYERKAILLLEKARDGQLSQADADRLAMQALMKKDEILRRVQSGEKSLQTYAQTVKQLEQQTMQLKMQIDHWETEIKTLKARAQLSQTTLALHERLAQIHAQGTFTFLDSLKEKVNEQEALAQAYIQLHQQPTSIDAEIDRILGINPATYPQLFSSSLSSGEKMLSSKTDSENLSTFTNELAKIKARLNNNQDLA